MGGFVTPGPGAADAAGGSGPAGDLGASPCVQGWGISSERANPPPAPLRGRGEPGSAGLPGTSPCRPRAEGPGEADMRCQSLGGGVFLPLWMWDWPSRRILPVPASSHVGPCPGRLLPPPHTPSWPPTVSTPPVSSLQPHPTQHPGPGWGTRQQEGAAHTLPS